MINDISINFSNSNNELIQNMILLLLTEIQSHKIIGNKINLLWLVLILYV